MPLPLLSDDLWILIHEFARHSNLVHASPAFGRLLRGRRLHVFADADDATAVAGLRAYGPRVRYLYLYPGTVLCRCATALVNLDVLKLHLVGAENVAALSALEHLPSPRRLTLSVHGVVDAAVARTVAHVARLPRALERLKASRRPCAHARRLPAIDGYVREGSDADALCTMLDLRGLTALRSLKVNLESSRQLVSDLPWVVTRWAEQAAVLRPLHTLCVRFRRFVATPGLLAALVDLVVTTGASNLTRLDVVLDGGGVTGDDLRPGAGRDLAPPRPRASRGSRASRSSAYSGSACVAPRCRARAA